MKLATDLSEEFGKRRCHDSHFADASFWGAGFDHVILDSHPVAQNQPTGQRLFL